MEKYELFKSGKIAPMQAAIENKGNRSFFITFIIATPALHV